MRAFNLLSSLLAACFSVVTCAPALAQSYPSKSIRILIGFAAGGSTDAVARYYGQKMAEDLKVPVIIENKPGGGQVLAIKAMTTSAPDGYTLYMGTGSAMSQGPGVRTDLPYDPLKDFSLIGMVSTAPGVIMVTPDLPVKSLRELAAYSNANPDKLNFGSSGIGSASHLQGEYLNRLANMKLTHIPYKADGDIVQAMYAGAVHVGLSPVQGAVAALASGKVRALAVTGSRRLAALPGVPSLAESDIKGLDGIDPYTYYGLVGPAGLPPSVVATLNDSINRVSKRSDVIAHVREKLYGDPAAGSTESFRKFIQADLEKWKAFSKHVKLTE